MGKTDWEHSASRFRSLRDTGSQISGNIPKISSQASGANREASYSPMRHTSTHSAVSLSPAAKSFSLDDLKKVAVCHPVCSYLRLDMQAATSRLEEVEEITERHDAAITATQHSLNTHSMQLKDIQRNIEDLDNRGRRHNIRIKGLLETVDPNHLTQAITTIFNDLLGRPPDIPIDLERLHRALRSRGRDTDPPRDVIGCLVNFKLKEEIIHQARLRGCILYRGTEIKLYHDLSQMTLQKHKILRPLLDIFRERNIPYRWKFPFCLQVGSGRRTAYLLHPEDVHPFCETLDIPPIEIPDWIRDPRSSSQQKEDPMDVHQRDSPSTNRRCQLIPRVPASPVHRKARKD